jgi:hypothetical protein
MPLTVAHNMTHAWAVGSAQLSSAQLRCYQLQEFSDASAADQLAQKQLLF